MTAPSNFFKIKIVEPSSKQEVVFEVTSPMTETRSATYESYNIIHMPTDLWSYRNTSGRKFGITGKFVSRTVAEARRNLYYLNLIRSWMQPGFGGSGSTPPVLELFAYNQANINGVNVVLKTYGWTFPDDVDYIFDPENTDVSLMPVIGTLQVDLDEVYSAEEISQVTPWQMKMGTTVKGDDADADSKGGFVLGGAAGTSLPYSVDFNAGPRYKFPGVASGLFGLPSIGSVLEKTVAPIVDVIRNPSSILSSSSISEEGIGTGVTPEKIAERAGNSQPNIVAAPLPSEDDYNHVTIVVQDLNED